MEKPFICIQTDFGLDNGSVSAMRGVIASIDPALRVHDVNHLLPLYQPWAASLCLEYTMPSWPPGTIFVSVVDPGVGTSRRACAAKTGAGQYIITPDNGTLTHIEALQGIQEVREINEGINRRPGSEKMNTFHGRDIFAYTAGRLASGLIGFEETGPAYPVAEIRRFPLEAPAFAPGRAEGMLTVVARRFGSIATNIPIEAFEAAGFREGDKARTRIRWEGSPGGGELFDAPTRYHRSFGFVEKGEPLLFNGSTGHLFIGINQGNFAEAQGIDAGPGWKIALDRLAT
jgi:S-adenosylmethionine hydrolase